MALQVKDLRITFNLDDFTWGDLDDLGRRGGLLDVCERHAVIEGVSQDKVRETLCQLGVREIAEIDRMLSDAMENLLNPTDETGKN